MYMYEVEGSAGGQRKLLSVTAKCKFWFGVKFYGPVNTIKVISSRSIYLTTLFLDRPRALSG